MSVSPWNGRMHPSSAAVSRCNAPAVRNRNHLPARLLRRIHTRRRVETDLQPLTVHAVLRNIVHTQRLESTGTDMQRNERTLDAHLFKPRQHGGVEMQTRGGRGDRTRSLCEHGLITLPISVQIRPRNIRRQRDMANVLENVQKLVGAPRTRFRRIRPSRPTTRARTAHSSNRPCPGFGGLLARHCASARRSSSTRSSSNSMRPPVSFSPNRRAGMTRVLLKTSRSPRASSAGRSAKRRSSICPVMPSRLSNRLDARSASGSWAMSSGGSW